MDSINSLRERARTKLKEIAISLDLELNLLKQQGALTELDKKKLIADATVSGQAILDAIERADYPEDIQREFIDRLIMQFQSSAQEIVSKARSRLYSNRSILAKLNDIEHRVFLGLKIPQERWASFQKQRLERLRQDYTKQIQALALIPLQIS